MSSKSFASAKQIGLQRPVAARRLVVRAEAPEAPVKERTAVKKADKGLLGELSGLGDALGPIGLTYSGGIKVRCAAVTPRARTRCVRRTVAIAAGAAPCCLEMAPQPHGAQERPP
jgi:hypothetical protein